MATTNPDLTLTSEWVDIAAIYSNLTAVPAFVQGKGPNEVLLYWGGTSAPSGPHGMILSRGMASFGTANNIWVRAMATGASVSCGIVDGSDI